MRINTNLAALNTWKSLSANQTNLQKSLERLSSGYRINRAADDAAGLAVSEKLKAQIRGINMATRNAQDGVSMIQTAEGGASKVQDMLQRMRELAVQASSGSLQDADRAQLDTEFQALKAEIGRTTDTTTFNGLELLKGATKSGTVSGAAATGVTVNASTASVGTHSVEVTQVATAATGSADLIGTQTAHTTNTASNSGYRLTLGATNITLDAGESYENLVDKINAGTSTHGVMAAWDSATSSISLFNTTNAGVAITEGYEDGTAGPDLFTDVSVAANGGSGYGAASTSDAALTVATNNDTSANSGYAITVSIGGAPAVTAFSVAGGVDFTAQNIVDGINSGAASSLVSASLEGGKLVITSKATGDDALVIGETAANGIAAYGGADPSPYGFAVTAGKDLAWKLDGVAQAGQNSNVMAVATGVTATAAAVGTATISVTDTSSMDIQVGANSGETIKVSIGSLAESNLGTSSLSIATLSDMDLGGAGDVLDALDTSINYVSNMRASLGAVQNRMDSAISNLQTMSENLTAADSRIRDVDMASEMAQFTKFQVLGQASTAMLAQANQLSQSILTLLR